MNRARAYIVAHDIVTLPPGEQISVIPTPEYLRSVLPFAAYFEPPKFDKHPSGIYVVTPSVGDDPNSMREHNYASISNTSVHEAYPGHHLQLSAAISHPSLVRLLTDANAQSNHQAGPAILPRRALFSNPPGRRFRPPVPDRRPGVHGTCRA